MSHARSGRRIHLLDEVRGLCVVLMVFYHAFYTIGYLFNLKFGEVLFEFFTPVEPLFAGLFVFICGICCNLSHNNFKRGALLAGVAVLMSMVLWCATQWKVLDESTMIWFGILHLLAVCILLYALLRPTLNFIPTWLGLALCVALFILCYHVSPYDGSYFGIKGVFEIDVPVTERNALSYALGLCYVGYAGDYFPLLPWIFCFFAGVYLGRWHRKFPSWTLRSRFPLFSAIGKVSLWVYIAHQPVIYGICFLLNLLVSRLF